MQDAQNAGWTRRPPLSTEMQRSVHDLNLRFFELMSDGEERSGAWRLLPGPRQAAGVCNQIARLSAAQKSAAANCPYALFDLQFHDDRHWQGRLEVDAWRVADQPIADAGALEFTRLAVFFAWHVASTGAQNAALLLGMSEITAAAFNAATIECLSAVAVGEWVNLSARWSQCRAFWTALTGAAARSNAGGLRRIQLYGLQLAAAARLA